MVDFETDPILHDIIITDNAPKTVTGQDAAAQSIRATLLTFQPEWFLDETFGVPWFAQILGRTFNAGQISAAIRDPLLTNPFVARVDGIETTRNREARIANVVARVLTQDGEAIAVSATI